MTNAPTETKALRTWTRHARSFPRLVRTMWTDAQLVARVQQAERHAGVAITDAAVIEAAIEQAFAGGAE